MSASAQALLIILFQGLCVLLGGALIIVTRRWFVAQRAARDRLRQRILRAELIQAVIRDNDGFVCRSWSARDRRAAFAVAAQLLALLPDRERGRLERIVEGHGVLAEAMRQLRHRSPHRRIAAARRLAPFGTPAVQDALHGSLRRDPSVRVRLEAAIAISVRGTLPPLWRLVRDVLPEGQPLTPNHRLLFRSLAPRCPDALVALATCQDEARLRVLAVDGLLHGAPSRLDHVADLLGDDPDPEVARLARIAAQEARAPRPRSAPQPAPAPPVTPPLLPRPRLAA
ncbi:hypothetical protein [Qipengyuania thermophila]|uniref:hypothetical protein n=1 Tax=Qipengyuania thermophila TaxID=2509361 RepID=UPI0013ED8C7D|nr:hypothetical protein [Qipengyuania thermophila]